jgi:hypothetical protein
VGLVFLRGEDLALLGVVRPLAPESVQPAGVDLTVSEVEELEDQGVLGVEERRLPEGRRLEPRGGWWELWPGAYRVRLARWWRYPQAT